MGVTLYLYDDETARSWHPFALTRPVGELLFGCSLLRRQAEITWRAECVGHVAAPELESFEEEGAPPVVPWEASSPDDTRIVLNSRVAWGAAEVPALDSAATLVVAGKTAGWILPPGAPGPPAEILKAGGEWKGGPEVSMNGLLLTHPWHLVAENADAVGRQAESLGFYRTVPVEGVIVLGEEQVFGAADAQVEPGVILDVRGGPIVLDAGAVVQAPARLTGPLYVGAKSTILGGSVGTSSIGPRCKVRGEVADTVITGYSNKAHDGHLGHALLGRWVNLGALTTNSDLKNTYGEVRVNRGAGPEPTGLMKVGCFLGDFVRTGIGTLLPTGAVVGAASNVFGSKTPAYVPPFTWSDGERMTDYRLDGFLDTARVVMARRDRQLPDGQARLLERAWDRTAELRRAHGVSF